MKKRQAIRIQRKQPKGQARNSSATRQQRRTRRPKTHREAWSGGSGGPVSSRALPFASLSEVPQDLLQRAAAEKYPWIRRFIEEDCPRGKLIEYARAYAAATGTPAESIPPYSTLNTWAHLYRQHGILGLVDRPRVDAGRSRQVVGKVADHFEVFATLGFGATKILNELSRLSPASELPSRSALYRAVKRFEVANPHLVAIARHGPVWFRHVARMALSHGILAGGVRLTIDSTVADQWVRIPDANGGGGWTPVRPVLTLVEDVGSRLLVTFNLSLFAIDSGTCLGVLGRAVDPARNYPGLQSVGVPYEITLDHGAEHLGQFRQALDRLTIAVVPRQPNDPRGGAHVERLIRTVQTEVFQNLPGYSKCERVFDPYAPPEHDAKRNLSQLKYEPYRRELPIEALPTLAQLEERILAWALIYNERPHPGLRANAPEVQGLLRSIQEIVRQRQQFTIDQEVA